ncbi:hypothetical protein LQ564_04595 [Massilia sp. G4R7]|uniref:Uncharacterized protein n=1 Tax=Massilia phyllostachyos TaxID=2898585 RepID=A0ABS8Q1G4_9BURK|nr:hypothetical protein [Massilia phyllostachyos]MCD2515586.1 hypothetical protein [Massilia phyllostachyos]
MKSTKTPTGNFHDLVGQAKTTSVIDTINLRAFENAGLQALVLVNPNNPILHSRAQPD